ncbi:MAG: hypothetical protein HYX26_04060 [Acidobacteriales bacterium]|nr:hypothetical protein [Terriglobales bacterium]
MLARADEGVWPALRAEKVSKERLRRYMLRGVGPQQGKVRAGGEVRSLLRFGRVNLVADDYPVPHDLDLILCRNVLIYFDQATKKKVVTKLLQHVGKGGYLFLGHSESLNTTVPGLHCVAPTVYQK